jgi:dihydroorotase/N-acyl-D-amino-acid deacylase
MRAVVRRVMRDGALGIASALIYPPGSFAGTDELVELSEAMAPYGGVYITHMRSEGDRLLQAAGEAIEIGRRADVPVEIFHLKAAGRRNWGKLEALVDTINAARAAGHDVQANMYPYPAASTGLSACLPPWAFAEDRFEERLRDSTQRIRIRRAMRARQTDWENWCQLATPEGVLLVGLDEPENQQWEGQRLAAVAEAQDRPWTETALDLIASEGGISTVYFAMSEQNMRLKLQQPWIKFGTDAGARNPETARSLTHPRAYGTYPRILSKYVREDGVLPLEDAIRKMPSAVTTRLSIESRGLLRKGFFADIVVFDPETIADRATFQQPHQLSEGVRHVLVNGTFVLRDGEHTGAAPGRAVRGPGYTPAEARPSP